MGADGSCVSTFCFSILLLFRLDINNLAKYKSSAFSYKFIFGKPGGHSNYSPTSASRTVSYNAPAGAKPSCGKIY